MNGNRLRIRLGDRSYDVLVSEGAWDALPALLTGDLRPGRVMLVSDDRVAGLYAREVLERVRASALPCILHTVPQGEDSKSFQELERLCRSMAAEGLDRSSAVLALGGGVVGDLAGVAASLYLRGVPFVQLPTTLLAMVDSSVGGKTGINIPEGKNLVGSFYQPSAVLAEVSTLSTLDIRDWYSGLVEALKIALTTDVELFSYLESLPDLGPTGGVDPARVILTACRRKAEVVEADERESGQRRVLNFGHTLAHALEACCGYGALRHGEAVALGMRAALQLSSERCGLSGDHLRRALAVLDRIPVPRFTVPGSMTEYMARDKKSEGGRLKVVLLRSLGCWQIETLENPEDLVRALHAPLVGN